MAYSSSQISSAILKLTFLISYVSNVLRPCYGHSAGEGFGFTAPLIHWSSPQSPYYKPNAKHVEMIQASVRASHARANYIQSIRSGSRKYPAPFVMYKDQEYVMVLNLGTPPVETYAVPDTGSNTIWLQCGPVCKCYNQRIPWFDPTKSTTYSTRNCSSFECKLALGAEIDERCKYPSQTCSYFIDYLDKSYSEGIIGTDAFTFRSDYGFGNYTMPNTIFGCGYNNTGLPGEDPETIRPPGIVGMGRQMPSLVSQVDLGQFSYCFSANAEKRRTGSFSIRFGLEASVSGHTTKLASNSFGWYIFAAVDGIYVDGEKLTGYPEWVFQYAEGGLGGLMMDTGTVYSEFQRDVFNSLVRKLKDTITINYDLDFSGSGYSLCYGAEYFLSVYIPDIEIRFKDNKETTYPFTYKNAWINNGEDQFCLAIFKSDEYMSIIGMLQQRDIKIGYDLQNNYASFYDTIDCQTLS